MIVLFIIKCISLIVATAMTINTLIKLGKQKEHFQIYPDSMKKEYYKEVRIMTITNIVSVLLIFISFFLFASNLFFIVILTSIFLSFNTLIQISDDSEDAHDDKKDRE